jgi:hypothetical protein
MHFYFLTHIESKKYHNFQHNPKAAITVVDDELQTTVQVTGELTEVPIGDEDTVAYHKLALLHPPGESTWTIPVSKMDTGRATLLKLTPLTLYYADFKSAASSSGDYIVQII